MQMGEDATLREALHDKPHTHIRAHTHTCTYAHTCISMYIVDISHHICEYLHLLGCRWGRTPLAEALHDKQGHIVQELLKHQCKLCLDDPAGEMCDFASQGDTENLIVLLSNGVDPNQGDYDGR